MRKAPLPLRRPCGYTARRRKSVRTLFSLLTVTQSLALAPQLHWTLALERLCNGIATEGAIAIAIAIAAAMPQPSQQP